MLSEYFATIEITENVDPKSSRQIKPPQGNIVFFTANLLGITYGTQYDENRTTNGIQYCDCVLAETLTLTSKVGAGETPVECKVDTVESVDLLPQINDNSQAYKRPLAVT